MNESLGGEQFLAARRTAPSRSTDRGLDAEYAWCRQVCQQSRSSFFTSFRLLDAPRRRAMYALYAFARITDDLGDNPAPPEERRCLLVAWQDSLQCLAATPTIDRIVEGREQSVALEQFQPLWPALANSVREFSIPLELLHAVVEGVRRDLAPQAPADWDDLVDYCYHVASAVGLACVHIWKRSDVGSDLPTQAAIDCGVAFQLTNILRDVAEDAAQGRLYLPLSELERFEVTSERWLAGEPDGDWQQLVFSIASEAEQRYQRGWTIMPYLTPRSQRMFALMWCSYRTLLQRVVAQRANLWEAPRIGLTTLQRMRLLARHMIFR